MDFSQGVLFDPGYSKYTLPFSANIDAAYKMIFSMKSQNQRKFKFRTLYPQLLKLLEHTISFYLGCLLWASYISQQFKNEPKDILDNNYIGQTVNEEEMLFEVNYVINYIDKLKKDCKYYLNTTCNLPDSWSQIMTVYKEFLTMNKFLVNAKTTSDILLPSIIKELSQEDRDNIVSNIENVVNSGKLTDLFQVKDLIF